MSRVITLIPGDGIGPEVTEAVVRIFAAAALDIEWERHDAGVTAFKRFKQSLPVELLDSIKRNKVALKGPVTTPIAEGIPSVNVGLRKSLDLYANLRPVRNLPGVSSRFTGVDLVIVRENTEDLYSGTRTRSGARRGREPENHHRARLDPDRAVRVRYVRAPRAQARHRDPQGEHHEARRRAVPREHPQGRARVPRRAPTTRRSSTPPACSW